MGLGSQPGEVLAAADELLLAGNPQAALACCQQLSDTGFAGPGLAWRLGRIHQVQGEIGAALRAYGHDFAQPTDNLRRTVEAAGEELTDVAQLLSWRASAHFLHGRRDECRRDALAAEELAADIQDESALAVVSTALALSAALDGDRRLNRVHYDTALHHAQAAGDELQQLRIRANRGSGLLEEGEFAEAVVELDTGLGMPGVHRYPTYEGLALTNRAEALFRLGRLDEAIADLRQARGLFVSSNSRMMAHTVTQLGELHRARGEPALARMEYEEALRLGEEAGDAQSTVRALSGLALLQVAEDPAEAASLLIRARAVGSTLHEVRLLLTMTLIDQATEHRESALSNVHAAAAAARKHRDRAGLAEALEIEAALEATPNPGRAAALFRQAVDTWQAVGDPIGQARAEVRLAAIDSTDQALPLLTHAEDRLRRAGAKTLVAEAEALHAQIRDRSWRTSVRCLGAFDATHNGIPVTSRSWGSRKPRDLVKILVTARGRPLSRETIADTLWPGENFTTCAGRLSVALSTIRRVLGPDALITQGPGVRLDTQAVDIDVERFLTLADTGQNKLAQGRPDAATDLAAAEACHRGELLPDDLYAPWTDLLREQVREAHTAVLRGLAGLSMIEGDYDGAVRRYLQLLELDPYDEHAHISLVQALIGLRRHGEARRRYSRYCVAMAELELPIAAFPTQPHRSQNPS